MNVLRDCKIAVVLLIAISLCLTESRSIAEHSSAESYGSWERAYDDTPIEVFPDYSNLVFEEVDVQVKEVGVQIDDWYIVVQKCIRKCVETQLNKSPRGKSDCVQRNCEFY